MNETLEVLEGLVTHPGWQVFVQHVGLEWGPKAYAARLKAAVSEARVHHTDASAAIERVDAANDAVAEVMQWPGQEVARLTRQQEEPAMASQSRRGRL